MHPPDTATRIAERVAALAALFTHIARTRMAGVPLLNPQLAVQPVGWQAAEPGWADGVLLTPWFMSLVRLPLQGDLAVLRVGHRGARACGSTVFDFLGHHEPGFGAWESCALFSPMGDFASQSQAQAVAEDALRLARAVAEPAHPTPPASPTRRSLLLGRAAP
ncbi:MAG: [NiFe]-hydrogenase assembly chaperone HybE [Proteobacteria bacterium]|nr:[NiFe]-hydrogenase assembly chaperone HybE [Pseudomonadota bacterium]